jgi:hypothetical protein
MRCKFGHWNKKLIDILQSWSQYGYQFFLTIQSSCNFCILVSSCIIMINTIIQVFQHFCCTLCHHDLTTIPVSYLSHLHHHHHHHDPATTLSIYLVLQNIIFVILLLLQICIITVIQHHHLIVQLILLLHIHLILYCHHHLTALLNHRISEHPIVLSQGISEYPHLDEIWVELVESKFRLFRHRSIGRRLPFASTFPTKPQPDSIQ